MTEVFTKQYVLKADESRDGHIEAYLTTFGNPDLVGDVIEQGALDDFVKNFDPETDKLLMMYEHDSHSIIGEWNVLTIDDYGVKGNGIIYTETSKGKDIQALLKRKAVASVSIGFRSSDYEMNDQGGRTFKTIQLVETSVVLRPANTQAKVLSVKSEDGFIETKQLKNLLKEAGLTKQEIEALFHGGWNGLKNLREDTSKTESLLEALKNFKL